ncbi:hypothetical protein ACWEKM_03785 [Streptomyces sp. NPDC004752]
MAARASLWAVTIATTLGTTLATTLGTPPSTAARMGGHTQPYYCPATAVPPPYHCLLREGSVLGAALQPGDQSR